MSVAQIQIQRPQRWDAPFSEEMTDQSVSRLMDLQPFCEMNEQRFSKALPLREILKNDCRIRSYAKNDIIIRQGDYGHSVFFVLQGEAIVALTNLPASLLGRQQRSPKNWWQAIAQLWTNSRAAESRNQIYAQSEKTSVRENGNQTQVFLQDIPGTLDLNQTYVMRSGELFGEIAALTRTPRTATVIANTDCQLLELRWQGLRDIIRRDNSLKQHVEKLYRENSLRSHLRQTDILGHLPEGTINQIAEATRFESFGSFEWNQSFKSMSRKDVAQRIEDEPLIAGQGEYADGLLLVRNGFARLSRLHGDGHQTIAYLGKGQSFGLRELAHNWLTGELRPWSLSLRAVGYVDILRIPTGVVEALILPGLNPDQMPPPIMDTTSERHQRPERRQSRRESDIETSLMEFLVANRFLNGTEAMLIDLDRCTRCDDCVRACATTHDNNPRFVRQGIQHDHWMVAGACMHCVDPICMIGCPTGAIGRDETTGSVVINDQTCIGCGTCANSCPYQNIRMVDIRDSLGIPLIDAETQKPIQKATKCDLCSQQLGGPACQRACPHDALLRIDLTNPLPLYQLTHR